MQHCRICCSCFEHADSKMHLKVANAESQSFRFSISLSAASFSGPTSAFPSASLSPALCLLLAHSHKRYDIWKIRESTPKPRRQRGGKLDYMRKKMRYGWDYCPEYFGLSQVSQEFVIPPTFSLISRHRLDTRKWTEKISKQKNRKKNDKMESNFQI